MNCKKKVVIIISVIIMCLAGIFWCIKDFARTDSNKNVTSNSDKKSINLSESNICTKVSDNIIKSTDKIEEVCVSDDSMNEQHVIIEHTNKRNLVYEKDKEKQIVKELPAESKIVLTKIYNKYIIFMEKNIEKHGEELFEVNTIYIYDTQSKSLTKVNGGSTAKKSDGTYYTNQYVVDFMKVYNGKVFYCLYKQTDNDSCESAVYMYDIENKNEQRIYTNERSEDKNVGIISFDVDIEKGFLICQESDNNYERLELINLNKNSRRILAKTKGMFELRLNYPQVVFNLDKDIHIYNIEKDEDDLCIKCDDAPYGIDLVDNKLIFTTKKSYCYSFKTKKLYDIKDAKYGLKANDRYIYYADKNKLYYMNIEDLK